jgi:hypothetical protein
MPTRSGCALIDMSLNIAFSRRLWPLGLTSNSEKGNACPDWWGTAVEWWDS